MSYQSRLSEARSGYASEGNTFNARMEEYGQINEHIDNLNNLAQQKDNFDITHPLEAGGSIEGSLIALKGLQHATLGTAEKPKFLGRVLNKLGENFDKSKLNLLNNNKRDGWSKNLKSTAEDLRGKAKDIRFKQKFRQGQKRAGGGEEEGDELGELGDNPFTAGDTVETVEAEATKEAPRDFKYDPNDVGAVASKEVEELDESESGMFKPLGVKSQGTGYYPNRNDSATSGGKVEADYEEDTTQTAEIGDAREALGLSRGKSVLKSTRETGGMGGEDFDAIAEEKVVNLGADTEATSGSVNYGGGGLGTSVRIFKTTGGRPGATVGSETTGETTGEAAEATNMGEELSSKVGGFVSSQGSNVRNIGQSLVEEGGRLKQNLGDFVGRQKASFNQGMTRGTGAVDDAAEGAGEAAGDAVADLGTTAGSEIGAGTLDAVAGGLEVAGAGLDATGIGAGAGLVVGAVGLAAGAYGAYESGKGIYEFIKQDLLHKADNAMTSFAKPMVSLAQKGLGVVPTFDTSHSITQTSNSW
tara:strand:+ start:1841 stop:3427 length:1587 start_codon:yes stop_codon:yes gene_type:complete